METLQELINTRGWQQLKELLEEKLAGNEGDNFYFIEGLFLIQQSLLNDASLLRHEFDQLHTLLKSVFERSYERFRDDPSYLFFVGYFITLCDWCFGQNGFSLSYAMLERATNLDPENLLFRWGYAFSTGQADARKLSAEIAQSNSVRDFLISRGSAGEFIAEQIRNLPYFLTLPKG